MAVHRNRCRDAGGRRQLVKPAPELRFDPQHLVDRDARGADEVDAAVVELALQGCDPSFGERAAARESEMKFTEAK